MQVLRLLAPRRGVATTVTAPTAAPEPADSSEAVDEEEEYDDDDEGSFFELDLSVRASSSSAGSASGSSDDSALTDLDFVISLHRSRSASPSFHFPAPPLPLLDLKPGSAGRGGLRALSFAGATASASSRNAALYGGRRSSFARSSGSARSLRLFMESPLAGDDAEEAEEREPEPRRAPSRDVIRRYLTKISMRLRRSVRPRRGGEGGFRRLRKSRSASAAVTATPAPAPSRRDDSLAEKQDGIASAIAHCKESLHRASRSLSLPDCGSPLPRSRSDPGNREAS